MDINPNNFFGAITFGNIVLWILGLATVVAVLDYVGFLPPRLAKWLARNRLEMILISLKRLGVQVCWNEEVITLNALERVLSATHIKEPEYKTHLRRLLVEDTFAGEFKIGDTRSFSSDGFIDVMGGSTSMARSLEYAKILNTHADIESIGTFDIVATPKTGSPILGYEFSRLVKKPLVLGVLKKVDDTSGKMGSHANLDFPAGLLLKGKKVLIVDDSSTGGRKVLTLVETLREEGAIISDALILFEPNGKGARELLEKNDIKLHSILAGPAGRF